MTICLWTFQPICFHQNPHITPTTLRRLYNKHTVARNAITVNQSGNYLPRSFQIFVYEIFSESHDSVAPVVIMAKIGSARAMRTIRMKNNNLILGGGIVTGSCHTTRRAGFINKAGLKEQLGRRQFQQKSHIIVRKD